MAFYNGDCLRSSTTRYEIDLVHLHQQAAILAVSSCRQRLAEGYNDRHEKGANAAAGGAEANVRNGQWAHNLTQAQANTTAPCALLGRHWSAGEQTGRAGRAGTGAGLLNTAQEP